MHDHLMRRFWLAGWVAVLLLAAGCFQPAGGGLEATGVAQALPTFTPFPTDTPSDIPLPSDTPTVFIIPDTETPIPTFAAQDAGTLIVQLPNDELDPIWQTATAVYLLTQGGQGQAVEIQPL